MVRFTQLLRGEPTRKKAIVRFAKKHGLIYFETVHPEKMDTPVIRGSTVSPDQVDAHYCIGAHAEYDMAFVERLASIAFEGYKTTTKRWYVLQIDLKNATELPYVFIGTKQQSKAYYAKILAARREVRYLSLVSTAKHTARFHSEYAVLASPAELPLLYKVFTDDVIDSMAAHHYPFSIEIEGDSVTVATEAVTSSEQLIDKLLHYGLWVAKAIDSKNV